MLLCVGVCAVSVTTEESTLLLTCGLGSPDGVGAPPLAEQTCVYVNLSTPFQSIILILSSFFSNPFEGLSSRSLACLEPSWTLAWNLAWTQSGANLDPNGISIWSYLKSFVYFCVGVTGTRLLRRVL